MVLRLWRLGLPQARHRGAGFQAGLVLLKVEGIALQQRVQASRGPKGLDQGIFPGRALPVSLHKFTRLLR